jgi:hypothetical protein
VFLPSTCSKSTRERSEREAVVDLIDHPSRIKQECYVTHRFCSMDGCFQCHIVSAPISSPRYSRGHPFPKSGIYISRGKWDGALSRSSERFLDTRSLAIICKHSITTYLITHLEQSSNKNRKPQLFRLEGASTARLFRYAEKSNMNTLFKNSYLSLPQNSSLLLLPSSGLLFAKSELFAD